MFSCGESATAVLFADPFSLIAASLLGAGDGVDGLGTAAACLLVLTFDAEDIVLICRWSYVANSSDCGVVACLLS
jgi:hypothetical protein